jgi:hypothetical protein
MAKLAELLEPIKDLGYLNNQNYISIMHEFNALLEEETIQVVTCYKKLL